MELTEEQILAAAIGAIAEETKADFSAIRVVSFKEIPKSSLEQYILDHKISYKKYQLGD